MSEEAAPPRGSSRAPRWRQSRYRHRLALVLTLALIVVVLVSLPLALGSMRTQLFGEQTGNLYDLVSGQVLTPADAARTLNQSFFNISIVGIDEGAQVVSLSIAADRTCPATRRPRSTSRVQTEAPRPYGVSLATSTARASSATRITAATGPKVSSS